MQTSTECGFDTFTLQATTAGNLHVEGLIFEEYASVCTPVLDMLVGLIILSFHFVDECSFAISDGQII